MTLTWDDKDKMIAAAMVKNFPGTWRPIDTAPKDGTKIDVWVVKTYTSPDRAPAEVGDSDIVGRRETDVVWQNATYPWEGGRWAQQGTSAVVCRWA